MTGGNDGGAINPQLRLALLIAAGVVLSNVVAAVLFERSRALGVDDLLAVSAGVAGALFVEFGLFRRRLR